MNTGIFPSIKEILLSWMGALAVGVLFLGASTVWAQCDFDPDTEGTQTEITAGWSTNAACDSSDSEVTFSGGRINATISNVTIFNFRGGSFGADGSVVANSQDAEVHFDFGSEKVVVISGREFVGFSRLYKLGSGLLVQAGNINLGDGGGRLYLTEGDYFVTASLSMGGYFVLRGEGKLVVIDSGSIIASKFLGGVLGQNILFAGGVVPDTIDLGGGNDILEINTGSLSADIELSTGDDTFKLNGFANFEGSVDFGPGNDKFYSYGHAQMSADVNMGDGESTVAIHGGTITVDMLTSRESDEFYFYGGTLHGEIETNAGGDTFNFMGGELGPKAEIRAIYKGPYNEPFDVGITVINVHSGKVGGRILLDSGDNLVNLYGGEISGYIDTFHGDNVFNMHGGKLTGIVDLANGDDVIHFYGGEIIDGGIWLGRGHSIAYWYQGGTSIPENSGSIIASDEYDEDTIIMELGRGASISHIIDATSVGLHFDSFEQLHWVDVIENNDNEAGNVPATSSTGLTGDWNICQPGLHPYFDLFPLIAYYVCTDDITPHTVAELHLQADFTYRMAQGTTLNVMQGGVLALPTGTVYMTDFVAAAATSTSNYQLNFDNGGVIRIIGVGEQQSRTTLALNNGNINLGTTADGVGIDLYGGDNQGRYVGTAVGGKFIYTFRLEFDQLLIDNVNANSALSSDSSTDKAIFKSTIAQLFTHIRAYEDTAQYYNGRVTIDYEVADDEDEAEQGLSALLLTLTFNRSSGIVSSSSAASSTSHRQRNWGLWDTYSELLGKDEIVLQQAYNQSLSPLAHAALGEDLARYQMTMLAQLLQHQQQQVVQQQIRQSADFHPQHLSSYLQGWVFNNYKQFKRDNDNSGSTQQEFGGDLAASGILLPVNEVASVGVWVGQSRVRREHGGGEHNNGAVNGSQMFHEYRGDWQGIYGEYRNFGIRMSAMLSHSEGEVDSHRYVNVGDSRLSGYGDFAVRLWHLQGNISPDKGWQLGSFNLMPQLQLRYLNQRQAAFNEQLLLAGAVGNYAVQSSHSELLQGGISIALSQVQDGVSSELRLGMLKQLFHTSNEISASAPDMSTLSAVDRYAWRQLFHLKLTQQITFATDLIGKFYYEGESDFNGYSTATAGIVLQQNF